VVLGASGAAVNCVVEHCDISTNLPLGIASFSLGNHTLRDNTISRNADFGIRVADNCQILNNRIAENGDNNNDGGVFVTGSGNIVQGNHFSLNSGSGVELYNTSSGNLVLANTFRGATVRVAGSGQTVAPVTAAGAAVTGTNSLVNIAY
jgi:parallel beta-helix repeat protein